MIKKPLNLSKNKMKELIILIVIALWFILFGINYVRYSNGQSLIFSIKTIREYEDGSVKEYFSLGYVYRIYNRQSINREELVPFWVSRENPEIKGDLPITYKDYNVPTNKGKLDKYKGLLYYYLNGKSFLGTYKCINTNTRCEKAFSGYDSFNLLNKDPLTRIDEKYNISMVHENYAFVDDSKEQDKIYGDPGYIRTIYLFDIENNEILAKYADIKAPVIDDFYETATSDNNRFIVKSFDNNKWGIINVNEDGSTDVVLDYEYNAIYYDVDTNYYILNSDDKWSIYDLDKNKTLVFDIEYPIYDVWVNNNNSYFYKTGVDVLQNGFNYVNYSVYRFDGSVFLKNASVMEVISKDNCLIYMDKDSISLKVVNYTNDLLGEYKLYFKELEYDDFSHPSFEIVKDKKGILNLKVYQGRDLMYGHESVSINYQYLVNSSNG